MVETKGTARSGRKLKSEEGVRQATLKELFRLGWREGQLQWKPERQVPKTPHDLTKRERGQKYDVCWKATRSLSLFQPEQAYRFSSLRFG